MNNDIITEWNSMSTEEQIKLITACVRKAANKDVGSYATSQHGHEINEFVNEAWERITNSLAARRADRLQQAESRPR